MNADGRATHIATVVGGVLRQALEDAGAGGIVLLDDGGPEASLAAAWSAAVLGEERVARVVGDRAAGMARRARLKGGGLGPGDPAEGGRPGAGPVAAAALDEEARRFEARLHASGTGWLCAHPVGKTVLLLDNRRAALASRRPVGQPGRPARRWLVGAGRDPRAGGGHRRDRAARRATDCAFRREARPFLRARAGAGARAWQTPGHARGARFARRRVGLVPKLGSRTAGIDLFG